MRDFDELFFFAGASESDIAKFTGETTLRGLTLQTSGLLSLMRRRFWQMYS
jgi:hypothetical protein